MKKELTLSYLDKPQPKKKYKRIIWCGVRNYKITLADGLHHETDTVISDDVQKVNMYPVLLTWETTGGEKRYAEIN